MEPVTVPVQEQSKQPISKIQPKGESARVKNPSEAPSAANTSLSVRMQKLEDALVVEHREHESTRSELRRTMREVELLREMLEARSNPQRQAPPQIATPSSEIPSRDSLFEANRAH